VVECRATLSYWRVRDVLDGEQGNPSPVGVDQFIGQLRSHK
jgi:hypothetical protein